MIEWQAGVADVSGHGASSAFVTVFLKALTNRIRRQFEKRTKVSTLSPGRMLQTMNDELKRLRTVFTRTGGIEQNYIPKGVLFDKRG